MAYRGPSAGSRSLQRGADLGSMLAVVRGRVLEDAEDAILLVTQAPHLIERVLGYAFDGAEQCGSAAVQQAEDFVSGLPGAGRLPSLGRGPAAEVGRRLR